MDRFIANITIINFCYILALKSNMDRFIGLTEPPPVASGDTLKSNMDRFIDLKII